MQVHCNLKDLCWRVLQGLKLFIFYVDLIFIKLVLKGLFGLPFSCFMFTLKSPFDFK